MKMDFQEAISSSDRQACFDLRRQVFVEEQNVPQGREADGLDTEARHFIVKDGDKMIATCRVRLMGSAAKIERVAVVKEMRGKGVGRELMKFILQMMLRAGDIRLLRLSSQADAVPFYEKLGFQVRGNEYMDAGMPHYDMVRELKNVKE